MFALCCGTSRSPRTRAGAYSSLKAFSTFRADRHRCMLVLRRRRKSEHCDCAGCGCHPSRGGTAKGAPANTPCPNGRTSRICRPDFACSSHVLASVRSAPDDAYRPQLIATGPSGTACQNSGSCPKKIRAPAVSSACDRSRNAIIASRSKTSRGRRLSSSVYRSAASAASTVSPLAGLTRSDW